MSAAHTVRVQRPEDAEGLETALDEYGITADITYVPEHQICAPGRYTPVDRRLSGMTISTGPDRLEGVTDQGGFSGSTDFDVTAGPVRPCSGVPNPLG